MEIQQDAGDIDAILVPWGGGGLTCGIAAVARALMPGVRVYACEVEGAAPLSASLAAGKPVTIENRRSFIDGIGGRGVFPEIWPLALELVAGSLVVTVDEVAGAVAQLARRARIVAEGAGAASLAAALGPVRQITPRPARVACIVSGGNIDSAILASILSGSIPR
jgi:threonine dehydratase